MERQKRLLHSTLTEKWEPKNLKRRTKFSSNRIYFKNVNINNTNNLNNKQNEISEVIRSKSHLKYYKQKYIELLKNNYEIYFIQNSLEQAFNIGVIQVVKI